MMKQAILIPAVWLSCAAGLFAASALKLEHDAEEKDSLDRHEAAVKLFIEAGDQRMKDAAVILVKGENNDDPLESDNFDAVPTEEGMNVFDEMINSKEAIAKSADTKNSFLIAAALDYEKGELSDKADKALALAEKVPGKSSGGELALLNAWISCWRLRAEYPSAIEATRKALKFVEDHDMPKAKRADLMNTLSNFLFNDRRYAEALDMRFAIVEMFPGERGRLGPIKGFIGSASGRGIGEVSESFIDSVEAGIVRPLD